MRRACACVMRGNSCIAPSESAVVIRWRRVRFMTILLWMISGRGCGEYADHFRADRAHAHRAARQARLRTRRTPLGPLDAAPLGGADLWHDWRGGRQGHFLT